MRLGAIYSLEDRTWIRPIKPTLSRFGKEFDPVHFNLSNPAKTENS